MTFLMMISCSRIKNKADHLSDKVKSKTKQEIKKQADKIFPSFDSDKPDTDNNKRRFQDFIKVEITSDVENIYCYNSAIGIDASYMFAFNCNQQKSDEIIKVHELLLDTNNQDNGFGLQQDFDWWDKSRIKELNKLIWTNGDRYYKYYWYDSENEKAYYFEFDM